MSRMLGILSQGTASPLWFERFGNDPVTGGDGCGIQGTWGIAGYLGRWATSFGKGAAACADAYGAACRKAIISGSRILLSHVQKTATEDGGEGKPLIYDTWIFCNRGTIMDPGRLAVPRFAYEGESASERLFKYLVDKLDHRSSVNYGSAVKQALDDIRSMCRADFLSFIMSDGKHLIACRDPYDNEGLSKLYTAAPEGALIVCSDALPGFAWKELEQGGMIVADRYGVIYGIR